MAEPTSSAVIAATVAVAGASIPVISLFGVPLGIKPDVLMAGFAGAIVAVILLNSVPSTGPTWQALVRDSMVRLMVVLASSLTAGHMAPLATLVYPDMPDSVIRIVAFAIGAGAREALVGVIDWGKRKISGQPTQPPQPNGGA